MLENSETFNFSSNPTAALREKCFQRLQAKSVEMATLISCDLRAEKTVLKGTCLSLVPIFCPLTKN
jgi:hypothetical protein